MTGKNPRRSDYHGVDGTHRNNKKYNWVVTLRYPNEIENIHTKCEHAAARIWNKAVMRNYSEDHSHYNAEIEYCTCAECDKFFDL